MCNACWATARRRETQAEAESAAKRARVAQPLAEQTARKMLLERLDLLERLAATSTGCSIAALTDPTKASLAVQRNWDVLQTIKAMRAAAFAD